MTVDESPPQDRANGALWFYALLGTLLSSLAIISLVEKALQIGLSPVLQEVLDSYRGFVRPIVNNVAHWVFPAWEVPDMFRDAWSLSFVCSAAFFRALLLSRPPVRNTLTRIVWIGLHSAGAVLFSVTILPPIVFVLAAIVFAYAHQIGEDGWWLRDYANRIGRNDEERAQLRFELEAHDARVQRLYRRLGSLMAYAIVGAFLFFAIDSQL